jgi:hypothetical protein
LWFGFGSVACGLFILARRLRSDFSARVVVIAGVTLPALFALLVTAKTRNYKMSFLPIWAIAAAWAVCELWRRSHGRREVRVAMVVIGIVVAIDGISHTRGIVAPGSTITPYASYIQRVHAHIRPGERVLGLHSHWLGLEDTDFHSWYVTTAQFEPSTSGRASPPLVIGTDPDVVLIDSAMRAFLNRSAAGDARAQAVEAWMRPWSLVALVDDATYGRMEIYRKR